MQTITSSAAMAAFLAQPLDPTLRRILADRVEQLTEYDGYDLGELARFSIVERGDTLEAIEAALGFSPFVCTPEGVTAHGGWFEAVFVLSDDGFGLVLLIPTEPVPSAQVQSLVQSLSEARSTS